MPTTSTTENLYSALVAAGHNVALWQNDPALLRDYAQAIGFTVPEVTVLDSPRGLNLEESIAWVKAQKR